MVNGAGTIRKANGFENEYVISDNLGISLGRFIIIERNKEDGYAIIKLRFYKKVANTFVEEILKKIIDPLFIKGKLRKVTFLVHEEMEPAAFIKLGFEIEGILANTIKGIEYKHQLIFSVEEETYLGASIKNNINLYSQNLELRLLTPEYAEELLDYYTRNKEHLKKYEPARDEYFYTIEMQRLALVDLYKAYLSGNSIGFGIFKDGNLIGKLQCTSIVYGVFKNGIIGYSMDEKYCGKGYMKEAVNLFCRYAKNSMELHRIEASTLLYNEKSQRVLIGCGFEEIGISKKYLLINGKWQDHKIFYKILT